MKELYKSRLLGAFIGLAIVGAILALSTPIGWLVAIAGSASLTWFANDTEVQWDLYEKSIERKEKDVE
ncbi:TPA: hypothetical protein ACWL3Y_000135 [Enterococcus faecalis]|nr:hypothetical protein [Enterococcus faecalis]NST43012.1 hypothetical protein [Enterococcus faecalis]HAP2960859.1 hypothetical protein [Enterococcus faecalis]